MTMLSERTRRALTLTLFFFLGPALLGVLGYRLFARSTSVALTKEESRLSQRTGFQVEIEEREYLRPGSQRLLNVEFTSSQTGKSAFFCPEIYLVRENDLNFIQQFASVFDQLSGSVYASPETAGGEDATTIVASVSENSETGVYPSVSDSQIITARRSSLVSTVSSCDSLQKDPNAKKESGSIQYVLVVVPVVFCRESQLLAIKSELIKLFQQLNQNTSANVYGMSIGKIVFQDDNSFNNTLTSDENTVRKSNQELASYFNGVLAEPNDDVLIQSQTSSPDDQVRSFESELPIVEHIKALYVSSPKETRIDALFELNKINQSCPFFISCENFQEQATSRIEFNSNGEPMPCSFAARFMPYFQNFGSTSYFLGKITVDAFSSEKGFIDANSLELNSSYAEETALTNGTSQKDSIPYWLARVESFRLCNGNMEDLSAKLNLPPFTGKLSDLYVVNGIIRQGVFEGFGSIKLSEGTIPVAVIEKLCENNCLEVIPPKILDYRFLNDAVPFNEFEILFETTKRGVIFDSHYRNKIVACYEKGTVKYAFFLPESTAGKPVPYAKPLRALLDVEEEEDLWSPLFRDAINHLPVSPKTKLSADALPDKPLIR